jgi:hypothetical protein
VVFFLSPRWGKFLFPKLRSIGVSTPHPVGGNLPLIKPFFRPFPQSIPYFSPLLSPSLFLPQTFSYSLFPNLLGMSSLVKKEERNLFAVELTDYFFALL